MTQSLVKSQNFTAHLMTRRRMRDDEHDNALFMKRKKSMPSYSYHDNDNNDFDADDNNFDADVDAQQNIYIQSTHHQLNDNDDDNFSVDAQQTIYLQSKHNQLNEIHNEQITNINPFKKYKAQFEEAKYIKQVNTVRCELDRLIEKRDKVKKDLEELLEKKKQVKQELEMIDPDLALTEKEKKENEESMKRRHELIYL
jgi:hypothetical protein